MRQFFLFLFSAAALSAATPLPLKVEKGARIVLIGNTLIERMQDHAWFEGMVLQRFAAEEPVIRTLAWPGDEITVQPRPQDYGDMHHHLAEARADIIIAGYGFNESFRGKEGLSDFEHNLRIFIAGLRAHQYNGRTAPLVVLVSPIPQESLPNAGLPPAEAGNARLKPYVDVLKKVADETGVGFVDAFHPLQDEYEKRQAGAVAATFNGIHLTDAGYRQFGEQLFQGLFQETPKDVPAILKEAIEDKNRQFVRQYRPLNLFYITGGRKDPYGVVNFPLELQKLGEMTTIRERRAWDIAQGKPVPPKVDDTPTTVLPKITGDRPINEWASPAGEREAFRVDPRFEVNLFASEEQFPDLAKPIQMRWDTRGRLWVSCSTTYPQVTPGQEPNDKIVILEDTDQDGRADTCKVFAEGLNIPLSFEFAKGGLYCSEQPHLTFLHDKDGDDRMDARSIVLTGFGTEDSHHSLHDFTWTPDGDLIFRESIFHHSSVETPYGPVRARDSSFFRFNPRTQKLTGFGSYMSTNPWGLTFDKWGWHLGSHPVFASAMHAVNRPYPEQHVPAGDYFPAYSGTCGQEFIYTKHFPEELQGCFVRVRYKPTNVVELHQWVEHDTHFEEKLIGHLWQSTNLSFIPVDVRFGPRGDLYICDWFNPVKGHMQYSLRDTRRDKTAGRIWRVTAKGRKLDEAPKIAGEPIGKLLDLLKAYEYRTRYTAKIELRNRDSAELRAALDKWAAALDPKDPEVEHHKLEALWVYLGCEPSAEYRRAHLWYHGENGGDIRLDGEGEYELHSSLLRSSNHHVRAAAQRGVRIRCDDWRLDALHEGTKDPSGLVRLEAVISSSYYRGLMPALLAMNALKYPRDAYVDYAIRTTLDASRDVWALNPNIVQDPVLQKFYADSEPKKKRVREKPDPFDKLNPTVVRIGTVAERMLFTVTEFTVKAGAPVKLIFDNTDATPHNLLIVQPGAEDEVGLAAIEMAKQPEALASMNFTPKSDRIVLASQMLKQGEAETMRFHAPKEPGRYPYICSFPGHYLVMKGVMIVE